jgi:peptide/nickel transport system substrate-binding protein
VDENALFEIIGRGEFDMFEWGWVVEPDPDYQLSTFTCDKRSYKDGGEIYADLSDSFFCDEDYDALYAAQATETDQAKRAEIVQQMQRILYDQVAYVVTWYYDNLEAYRSDRFTGFVGQPEGSGSLLFQYGTYSYENVEPISADGGDTAAPSPDASESADAGGGTATEETSGGSNTGLIIGLIVAALVIAGLVIALVRMRSKSTEDMKE